LNQLSQRLAGRMAAILFVAGGLGTFSSVLLPAQPGMQPPGIVAVSVAAVLMGVVVWFLPWDRWRQRSSLVLVPIAFVLIAFGNHFAAAEPFRYAIFFTVAFTWIGFSHRRGTSLAFAPLFVAAYLVPLFTAGAAAPTALGSLVIAGPICLAVGESIAWVSSRLRQVELDLARMRGESHFRSLIQHASDLIVVLDEKGDVRYESPSVARVLGRVNEPGGHLVDLVHADDRPLVQAALADVYAGRSAEHRLEFRVRTRDGAARVVEAVMQNLLHDEHLAGIVLNMRDVSDRKALEEALRQQAFHDALTGLANRTLFSDRVEHALAQRDVAGRTLAVLFIDLDDFKTINDSLGHAVGDRLLVTISHRLRSCLRPSDTAARLGGDEFGVLLEDVEPGEAEIVAARILTALHEPVRLQRRELSVEASIGIAIGQPSRHRAEELLRNADAAMYSAKASGKGSYEVFKTRMQRAAAHRLRMKADLERAVDERQFTLRYQPVVELSTGEMQGVEALIRWHHPRRGLVMPDEFIRLTEESGLVVPLGRWVLNEATADATTLSVASGMPLTVSVNISPRQLREPGFAADVAGALARATLPASRLILEITEGVLMHDSQATVDALRSLRRMGVRIAIADFGTGYSSLSSLRRHPVDVLKIAAPFIVAMDGGGDESALVQSMLMLARALRLETVAEGVEDAGQAAELRTLGAQRAQGNYFAPELTLDDLKALVEQGPLPGMAATMRAAIAGNPAG
jgi:diguanylate cyclase (GGDEF)-like protein/PAS domain S-box-containing protein